MAANPSLSAVVDPTPSHRLRHPPLPAFPIEGKPGSYEIDGLLITPETVFSYSKRRLKGRPYMRAYAYVLAESKRLRGALVCEMGGHYTTEGDGSVHHRLRRDFHQAKTLGLACIGCNAVHGDPSLRSTYQREEIERENNADLHEPRAEWTSEEGRRSDKMTFRYRQKLYHPETGLKEGDVRNLKKFAADLADEFGIGQPQSYQRYMENDALAGYFRSFEEDGTDKIERTNKPYPLSRLGIKEAPTEAKTEMTI